MLSPVNSHNEWDKLEEVIVGNGFPEKFPLMEFSFQRFFHDNIYNRRCGALPLREYITEKHIHEHNIDVENFVDLLKSNGIIVRRPKTPKSTVNTKTLAWSSTNFPALNVRDQTIIIGDEIIETPVVTRFRMFENDYMKHLFLEYFNAGAKWTQCPRPIMTDNSFDMSYVYKTPGARDFYENIKNRHKHDLDCGYEIMFDGANCMRLGEHIIFNTSTKNESLGVQWLKRHLGGRYKIWEVHITDNHIDSSFLPIRPGLAIITNEKHRSKLPTELRDKWDIVLVPPIKRTQTQTDADIIPLASEYVLLNILSIDDSTIICHNEYQKKLSVALSKYKINVIPSQMRHCEIFAGAHHCLTLDIRRSSKLENYF